MKKAACLLVFLMFVAMGAVGQESNNPVRLCTGDVPCEAIRAAALAVMQDTTPLEVLDPVDWGTLFEHYLNATDGTMKLRSVDAGIFALVSGKRVITVYINAENFQCPIFERGTRGSVGRKFDTDSTMETLTTVRGFLNGWEAAHGQ